MKVLAIILASIIFVAGLVWYLNPQQRFYTKRVPILASPNMANKVADEFSHRDDGAHKIKFNILLLGIDARRQEESRTDVIMLANVNPQEKIINVVSIPRDTRVNIDGVGYTKINHAHFLGERKGGNHSGTKESMQAVSNLCKCDINYYLKVDFKGFEEFVDTIGGVEVELPQPVKLTYSNIILPATKQRIDGGTALQLVRERESLSNGDFGRQKNQALVLKALILRLLESQNMERIPKLVKQFKEDVIDINLTESDMISLLFMLRNISEQNINYIQIPGQDGYAVDPLLKKRLYYWFPDSEKVEEISKQYLGMTIEMGDAESYPDKSISRKENKAIN